MRGIYVAQNIKELHTFVSNSDAFQSTKMYIVAIN